MVNLKAFFSKAYRWRVLLIFAAIAAVLFLLYFWRLGSLTAGFSTAEISYRNQVSDYHNIIDNPLFWIHSVLLWMLQTADLRNQLWMRLPAAVLSIGLLYIFYRLLKTWFGRFSAILGMFLLAATPLLIIFSRSSEPIILLLYSIAYIASLFWLDRTAGSSSFAWFIMILTISLAFYIPGMVWLTLLAAVFGFKKISTVMNTLGLVKVFSGMLLLVMFLIPLAIASYKQPVLLRDLLLVPNSFLGFVDTSKSFAQLFLAYFWQTPNNESYNLARLPLLNLMQLALLLFGAYVLLKRVPVKTYFFISIAIISYIMASLNQKFYYLIIGLPSLVILMTAGVRFLYAEWRTRFPRNPLAKGLALFLMIAIISLHIMIGFRQAIVAWPKTLATKNTYMLK